MGERLKAPFPWFGGKSRIAPEIWARLGTVPNYIEPFAGALGCLLQRPDEAGIETINDLDGFVSNAWRALQANPELTAAWSSGPVSECDLHARHLWLRERRSALSARLMAAPDYYDAKIAGWWLWGIACWIGGGWCSPNGSGPWGIEKDSEGFPRFCHLGARQGVKRSLPHLGDAGQGVKRSLPPLGDAGRGVMKRGSGLFPWFQALQTRLARVRVCCGDWTRVMGAAVSIHNGLTGILLDPPYSTEESRDMRLYAEDSGTVAHDVRAWCEKEGGHPKLRVILCGYGEVHNALLAHGWTKHTWKAFGGYGNHGAKSQANINTARETLWCSPHCLQPQTAQIGLWEETQ